MDRLSQNDTRDMAFIYVVHMYRYLLLYGRMKESDYWCTYIILEPKIYLLPNLDSRVRVGLLCGFQG